MRFSNTCVVCGQVYWAARSHAQTCSPKCRSKLSRIRAKKERTMKQQTMTIEQSVNIMTIAEVSPSAAAALRGIYAVYGKDVLTEALDAVIHVWNDCNAYHERGQKGEAK